MWIFGVISCRACSRQRLLPDRRTGNAPTPNILLFKEYSFLIHLFYTNFWTWFYWRVAKQSAVTELIRAQGGYKISFFFIGQFSFWWKEAFAKKTSDLDNVSSWKENGGGVILSHVLHIYCVILSHVLHIYCVILSHVLYIYCVILSHGATLNNTSGGSNSDSGVSGWLDRGSIHSPH